MGAYFGKHDEILEGMYKLGGIIIENIGFGIDNVLE